MAEKNYYMESDAVDMCIERMRGHITTMEQRALIASNLLYPMHKDISRLIDAILYGPDYPTDEEIENILKKTAANSIDEKTMKDVIEEVSRYAENDEEVSCYATDDV